MGKTASFSPSSWGGPCRGCPGQGGCRGPIPNPSCTKGRQGLSCVSAVLQNPPPLNVPHVRVHRGEKYPCNKGGKVLANRKMWSRHTKACVCGSKVACLDCGKQYANSQGMKQHHKAKHGADIPEVDKHYICPYCQKGFRVKKTWVEHKPYCSNNPDKKGPYYCRVAGCPAADHPFTWMRNLNLHMSNMHGWKEMGLSSGNSAECVSNDGEQVIG